MAAHTIDHATLENLIEAGSVRSATAVAHGDSWSLVVRYGMTEKAVAAKNSKRVREWRHLDTLAKYLKGLGIARFETDAADYNPAQKSVTRPDRSAALRKTHEAAAHDEWFRQQVGDALAALDEGEEPLSHDSVTARWSARRAALTNQAGEEDK